MYEVADLGTVDITDASEANKLLGVENDDLENRFGSAGTYKMQGFVDPSSGKVQDVGFTINEIGTDLWTTNFVEEDRLERLLDSYSYELNDGVSRDSDGKLDASQALSLGADAAAELLLPGSGVVTAPVIEAVGGAVSPSDRLSELQEQVAQAEDASMSIGENDGLAPEVVASEGLALEGDPATSLVDGLQVADAKPAAETIGAKYTGPIASVSDDLVLQRSDTGLVAHRVDAFADPDLLKPGKEPLEISYDHNGASAGVVKELTCDVGLSL